MDLVYVVAILLLFGPFLALYAAIKAGMTSKSLEKLESDLASYIVPVKEFERLFHRVKALEANIAELRQQLQSISTVEKESLSVTPLLPEGSKLDAPQEPPPSAEAALPSVTMGQEQVSPTSPPLQSSQVTAPEEPPTVEPNVPATPAPQIPPKPGIPSVPAQPPRVFKPLFTGDELPEGEPSLPPPPIPTAVPPDEAPAQPPPPVPTAVPPDEAPAQPPPPVPTAVAPAAPVRQFASKVSTPSPPRATVETLASPKRARSTFDLEAMIGGEWLNKIGVAILVIGISLLLGYSFQYLGPVGKVLFGFTVSLTLLGGGVFFEKRETYRLYARGLIGGGWALVYFTTYAMHHIEVVRLIDNPLMGLVLLYLVAGGIIAHSLKYESQLITGMAYLLGFLTMAFSHVTLFSLGASLILAASLVLITWRMNWFSLGFVGLLAAYGNYSLWFFPMTMSSRATESFVFLLLFWSVFTVPNFLLKPSTDKQEKITQSINLVNTLLFLSLLAFQERNPELRYLFLTSFGFIYVGLSYLSKVFQRRISFLLFITIGIGLLVAAVPSALSGSPVTLLWLLEAEIVLLAGFYLKEPYFRKLAWVAFALVFIKSINVHWPINLSVAATMTFALGLGVFYANGYYIYSAFRDRVHDAEARLMPRIFSYGGFVLSVLLARSLLGMELIAVGWAIFGLLLFGLGERFREVDLRGQGYIAALLAFGMLFLVNFPAGGAFVGLPLRLMSVTLVATCFYYFGYRIHRTPMSQRASPDERLVSRGMLFAASLLVTVLLWYELPVVALAVGWAFFGVALAEIGHRYAHLDLRLQGYLVSALAAGQLFVMNFTSQQELFGVSQRLIIVPVVVLCFYYLYIRLRAQTRRGLVAAGESLVPEVYSYGAAAALAMLFLFELDASWIIVAWSGLASAFLAIGLAFQNGTFRAQGYLVTAMTIYLTGIINLGIEDERFITVGLVVVALYGCLTLILLSRRREMRRQEVFSMKGQPVTIGEEELSAVGTGGSAAVSEPLMLLSKKIDFHSTSLYFYSATALLTILLALEVERDLLTVAWGLEGLVLFVVGLARRERMFRLSGLLLLLICTLKIFFLDLRGLETLPRIISFIGLGIILLLVSYLYTRYREFISRFL